MLAMTCSKCGRRFTPSGEALRTYLAESEGKKHGLVICPHCGHDNKVAVTRLQQAVRLTPGEPAKPE